MRALPCECEASHVAVVGQPLQLLSDFGTNNAGPTPTTHAATIARDKFAQKLLSLRRDTVARIFAKQFVCKADATPPRSSTSIREAIHEPDTDLGRASYCLLRKLTRYAVDSFETPWCNCFNPIK